LNIALMGAFQMAKKASGYSIGRDDVPTILAMNARGDRDHDIAAWFGVNQGRIAEAKEGKWGSPAMASQDGLPPKGPPGIKGRRLRDVVAMAIQELPTDPEAALEYLRDGVGEYDSHEA
jgi:hypothetical protein